jgi:eukaryotic-like serine/threonine-protein kinase
MKLVKNVSAIFFIVFLFLTGKISSQTRNSSIIPWKYQTSGQINATPVISDDILYIGSFDSCFYAIDTKSGTEKWHYRTSDKIYTTAAISDGILIFESGNILYGLNLQGELVWKFTLYDGAVVNQNDEWDYYRSSPAVFGTTVYIGSEKGVVYGIDVKTGNKVFQCQAPTAKYAVKTTPAIFDNKVYFGDWDGVFYVYDLTSDSLVWSRDTKKDNLYSGWIEAIVTDPVVVGDVIYFGGRSCNLYCLDARTGTKKWSWHDGGDMWMVGGPTIKDGILYIGSSYQHVVRAFNAEKGTLLWQANIVYRANGKPIIDGDYVFVGTEHDENAKIGSICTIDKSTGRVISKLEMGGQIYSTPLIKDDLIYFGLNDGNVYAVSRPAIINVPALSHGFGNSIAFGKKQNSQTREVSGYVFNRGSVEDSILITSSVSQISIIPSNFKLAAQDSQLVIVKLDTTSLTPKRYSAYVYFNSLRSVSPVSISEYVSYEITATTGVNKDENKPGSFKLNQNYPNPFNPETIISYQLPVTSMVNVKIYDMLGNEMATLINEEQNAGEYQVKFDGTDLSSGIYLYRIQTNNYTETNKMILMR